MNKHALRMNEALTTYRKAKENAAARVEEYTRKGGPGLGLEEKEYQAGRLQIARDAAAAEIKAAYNDGVEAAKYWGRLYGGKLTEDVELLKNDLVNVEQFDELVARYQDNATMLSALKQYGERKNAAMTQEETLMKPVYNVRGIATMEDRLNNWVKVKAQALDMLDAMDGAGKYREYESIGRILSEEAIGKIGEGVAL